MAQGFSNDESVSVAARTTTFKSVRINYNDATGTYTIPVKTGQVVLRGGVNVITAFDGSTPTLKVGDGSDDDGYIDTTDIGMSTARSATTPAVKLFSDSGNPYAKGKVYVEDDTVDFIFTAAASPTTGLLVGWVELADFSNDGIAVA